MRADYSISCESKRYIFGYYWAIGMIFIYPIGCPLLFVWLLFSYRHEISVTQSPYDTPYQTLISLDTIQFLYSSYKRKYWWWEILETFQRLFLTGILVLIAQGSAMQIVIGALMTLLFLFFYAKYEPFLDELMLSIKIISNWQIFFVFWLALLIKANFGSLNPSMLGILLILALFMNLFHDFLKFFWAIISQSEYFSHSNFEDEIFSPIPPLERKTEMELTSQRFTLKSDEGIDS